VKRGRPQRRTPLRRGRPLRPRSAKATEQAVERKRNLLETFGYYPLCAGWKIIPACVPWQHHAEDGHEPRKRSQGADPTDPQQVIPVCRRAHDWIGEHPAEAARLRARDGRVFLLLADPLANP
jgi:hypothetical protein